MDRGDHGLTSIRAVLLTAVTGDRSRRGGLTLVRLLVVEDSADDVESLRRALRSGAREPPDTRHAQSLQQALAALESDSFDAVILDLSLHDSDGIDTLQALLDSGAKPTPPVVVLTGIHDEDIALRAVQAGAQDYLVKDDLDPRLLVRALRYAVERHRLTVELLSANRQVQFLASHCSLTGLPNRFLLVDRLEQSIATARRTGDGLALLCLDIDRFKAINDGIGHAGGDELLVILSERLQTCLRASDTAARLGADEFSVVLGQIARPSDATAVAEKLVEALCVPVVLRGHEICATTSIGMALFPDDGDDVETLFSKADTALNEAKKVGGDCYRFFAPDMNRVSIERLELEKDLRRACERDEFLLHYQPILEGESGRICGAEALVRWQHPERGLIPPGEFISAAEDTGLITQVGEWVLAEACRKAVAWQRAGLVVGRVSVNVSPHQFWQSEFRRVVEETLAATGLSGTDLNLEITESCLMRDIDATRLTLVALRDLGIRISIDDFGTGFSSLSVLKRLPIDRLKIDRCFVAEAATDHDGAAITRAIIALASSLGLETVAEGVETEEQLAFLLDHDCALMQGFLFSPPVPAADFAALLRAGSVARKGVAGERL